MENKTIQFIAVKNGIRTGQCSPPDILKAQNQWHEHSEDAEHLTKRNWEYDIKSDDYAKYLAEFIKILSRFEYMWERHLGQVKAARNNLLSWTIEHNRQKQNNNYI